MKKLVSVAFLFAVAVLGVGCVSYPVVRPDAFQPQMQRVAIVLFDSEAATGGTLGVPLQVELAKPFRAFRDTLVDSKRFEVIPTEALQSSQLYASLRPPFIDMGTAAPGLRRAYLDQAQVPALAKELGADLLITVHHRPVVQQGVQIMGMGSSTVNVNTRLTAYSASGQEVWSDVLDTSSSSFPNIGSMMDPNAVQEGARQASQNAATQFLARLSAKLLAPPPAK